MFFSLINLHTIPHNDKAKTCFYNFLQVYKAKKITFTHSKYLDTLLSTLLKELWERTASSLLGYDATSLRFDLTPVFGELLSFSSADPLKRCQVGWEALLHRYFQVSPEIFDQIQVPKPLLRCLGSTLRVVVLLEGEPSPQSEVLKALEQVFIKDLSVFALYILASILISLPVTEAEKHPTCLVYTTAAGDE